MAIYDDVKEVNRKIYIIFQRRKAALYALCLDYAARALQDFRSEQATDTYWINRTFTAVDTVFSDAFIDSDTVGWLIAHGVEYGVYLELANDGKHQALRPTINKFVKPFKSAATELMGG